MCTTSNHLKLCTCATSIDLNAIDHWVLKQAETNQDGIKYANATLGMCVIPNDTIISPTEDKLNVEIRFIRYAVQSKLPTALGYNKNKTEDKAFIMANLSQIKNEQFKNEILKYLQENT